LPFLCSPGAPCPRTRTTRQVIRRSARRARRQAVPVRSRRKPSERRLRRLLKLTARRSPTPSRSRKTVPMWSDFPRNRPRVLVRPVLPRPSHRERRTLRHACADRRAPHVAARLIRARDESGHDSSVIVRINDRGPFARGRMIDLSMAAATALDMRTPARRACRSKV
jgi:hypothetical protein